MMVRFHMHENFGLLRTMERLLVHGKIDVADECGGLPPGKAAELFQPYEQRGADRSGLGLGLAICMRGALSIGATLLVRDVPGTGCVFSLELRRSATS